LVSVLIQIFEYLHSTTLSTDNNAELLVIMNLLFVSLQLVKDGRELGSSEKNSFRQTDVGDRLVVEIILLSHFTYSFTYLVF